MKIKCLVACTNSNGESELFLTTVECTQEEYDNGVHYEKAKEAAEDERYESPVWVADENEPGFTIPAEYEEVPAPTGTVSERILSALKKADEVVQTDNESTETSDFLNGTPEEGDPECLVIAFGDHTHISVSDLERATLLQDGNGDCNGFKLDNAVYRMFSTAPVRI